MGGEHLTGTVTLVSHNVLPPVLVDIRIGSGCARGGTQLLSLDVADGVEGGLPGGHLLGRSWRQGLAAPEDERTGWYKGYHLF